MGKIIKIVVIAIPVLLIGGVICAPQITSYMARNAFKKENVNSEWAPTAAYRAGRVNMKLFRYNAGAKMLDKARKTWPKEAWQKDILFQIAFCHEKADRGAEAIKWYEQFLKKYPKHPWAEQAKKRIENIKAVVDL